ncbi:MAG: pseudouridine synthase [Candidatus Aminicenantes bacterium]|nr:pseudouridine synthase [Candidatus Aminicenantes bacterium]
MEIRLNKYLAQRGVASRREADRMIQEGRVAVNGRVVEDLGHKIDDGRDRVAVDGRKIKPGRELVYMMLNKPKGFLVTLADPLGRATIKNLIPSLPDGVNPVGRLDKDSEGLLLLTNDGEMANRLTHPRYEVRKIYIVCVEGRISPEEIDRLEKGVHIDGGMTAPAKVKVLESRPQSSVLQIEIHEGRKREVRQMCESVGHEVVRLTRVSFAGLRLETLLNGQWRFLKKEEVHRLKRLAGLS